MKINDRPVLALLDTGCTKSIVHPHCVQESNNLSWKIPYKAASSTKTCFPAAKITLQIEGKDTELAVGVSPRSLWTVARARRSPLQEVAEGGPKGRD